LENTEDNLRQTAAVLQQKEQRLLTFRVLYCTVWAVDCSCVCYTEREREIERDGVEEKIDKNRKKHSRSHKLYFV